MISKEKPILRKFPPRAYLLIALVLLGCFAFYLILSSQHFFADGPTESLNPNFRLSRIALFSSGSTKSSNSDIEISLPKGAKESFEILAENNSNESYDNLSILKNSLISGSGDQISSSAIDERVVHKWPQKLVTWGNPNAFTATPQIVEELLVKNESPSVTPAAASYNGDNFFSNSIGVDTSELLRRNGYSQSESGDSVKTKFPAGASKKFYFSISAPTNKAGVYRSQIKFVDQANNRIVAKFNLKVTIYDYALSDSLLRENGLAHGCYLNDQIALVGQNIPDSVKHWFVSESLFNERLHQVTANGCSSIVVRMGRYSDSAKMLQVLQSNGIAGPIIINHYGGTTTLDTDDTMSTDASKQDFLSIVNMIKANQAITYPTLFYGIDEPNDAGRLALHKTKADNILSVLRQVFPSNDSRIIPQVTTSATVGTWAGLQAGDVAYRTDYPITNYKTPDFITDLVNPVLSGVHNLKPGEGYYFQGWNEVQKANGNYTPINRYLMGLGFYKSGLKRAFINPVYGYRGVGYRPIYDDYAVPNATAEWQKPMFTFYPASDGLIPTLQSEAWREGVNDLKYFLSYKNIVQSGLSQLPESKRQQLSELSVRIEELLGLYNFSVNDYTFPTGLTAEKMDEARYYLGEYLKCYFRPEVPSISGINVVEGQVVLAKTYKFSANINSAAQIDKVTFLINGQQIGTVSDPAENGSYDMVMNMEDYNGQTINFEIRAVDNFEGISSKNLNISVRLSSDKPSFISQINIAEGQIVRSDPYVLSVKVKDPLIVEKVEFYVDDILLGIARTPDISGAYDWPWETSKYHSTVKIIVYGYDGTREEIVREATVSLNGGGDSPSVMDDADEPTSSTGSIARSVTNASVVTILPKTGRDTGLQSWIIGVWRQINPEN